MSPNNDYNDLALPQSKASRSFLTYFKIIFFPTVIYALMVLGYFNIIDFKVQIHTLAMTGFIFLISLFFAYQSAELATGLLLRNFDDFKSRLKNYIVTNLLDIAGNKKSSANFDDFLENYTRDFRNDNIASIGAGVFPMLGILGTFISIAITMPSFQTDDLVGLENQITKLLGGVSSAFYVSIYGIFLALWWIFFEKIGLSKFERFAKEQKDLSREFFWQKDELQQKFISASSSHFSDIELLLSKVSNEEFFGHLDNVVKQKIQSLEDLSTFEQKMIGESQVKVEQNIRLLHKAGLKQDEFVNVHTEILKAVVSLNSSLKEIEMKFLTQYNRLNDIMQDRSNAVEKNLNRFDQNIKNFELSLERFATKLSYEQNLAMNTFKDSMIEGISAFRSVYAEESTVDDKNNVLGELKKSTQEINEEIERVIKNIQSSSVPDEIK